MARNVFQTAATWLERGEPCALATLVGTRGGAPVPLGSTLAVSGAMNIAGGLGAGCYESEIVSAAFLTCADGAARYLEIDLGTDDDPLSASSGCGTVLEIAVWKPAREEAQTLHRIAEGEHDVTLTVHYERCGLPQIFQHAFAAAYRLIIVGATPLADEISFFARRLEFRTVVVDPRPAYATSERLPNVTNITVQWPDDALPSLLAGGAAIIVLSHDPKIDLPALRCALRSSSRYIALLGSRASQRTRRKQLRADGFCEKDLSRINGPAGLDIGGETTAETALSILAELVARTHDRSGGTLSNCDISIHSTKVAMRLAGN